jgi:hypothetical protein
MARRNFKVYFARTKVGAAATPMSALLPPSLIAAGGKHLPILDVLGERFQIRNLKLIGTVWQGAFVRLRDDAPMYLDHQIDEERELQIGDGNSVIEKCCFLYRIDNNVLIWQYSRVTGSLDRMVAYLTGIFGAQTSLPFINDNEKLEDKLKKNLYEIELSYERPPALPPGVGVWSQRAFQIARETHAAVAVFTLRADRSSHLGSQAADFVREAAGFGFNKVKLRAESNERLADVLLAPIKETFTIDVTGKYAPEAIVFQELGSAYDRRQAQMPASPSP